MRVPRILMTGLAAAVAAGLALAAAPAASASTSASSPGTASLAALLTSDGNTFDHNSHDYDIVTEAVLAVLAAKPKSPVGLLTDGSVALTAFVPTDEAFRLLVKDLTGKKIRSEKKVFEAVAGLGIDTVETVLLYHVVPGATIDSKAALGSDGAALVTAQGGTVTVDVHTCWGLQFITLADQDPDDRDPVVTAYDLNKGNLQIAHGINRVLRPLDL